MKALALAAAVSLAFSFAAFAQDSKPSLKPNGVAKQPAEASANIDVAAIQKKIDEFSEAIRREPKNDKFYGARGQGYKRIGKFENALADLGVAISINPNRFAYYEVRGNTYLELKRYKEAYQDFSRAVASAPPTYSLYLKQAQSATMLGDCRNALSAAQNALKVKEDDPEALVLLGGAEQSVGMLNESLRHLSRAIEQKPNDGGAYSMRAETYKLLGKNGLASRDKESARHLGFLK